MFEERGAVEAGQAVRVGWEMRGDPVEDDTETGGVKRLDETHEVARRSEPAAWCEKAERLVAPRSAEGILGDRQKLDVGEIHFREVRDKMFDREIPNRSAMAMMLWFKPRPDMNLVNGNRLVRPMPAVAVGHPLLRRASDKIGRRHDGCGI